MEHLLLGQVVLLGAALWLVHGATLREAARSRILIAMGLAGGLGLYCGFQIVDVLLPVVDHRKAPDSGQQTGERERSRLPWPAEVR